jgi:hypothetical protein
METCILWCTVPVFPQWQNLKPEGQSNVRRNLRCALSEISFLPSKEGWKSKEGQLADSYASLTCSVHQFMPQCWVLHDAEIARDQVTYFFIVILTPLALLTTVPSNQPLYTPLILPHSTHQLHCCLVYPVSAKPQVKRCHPCTSTPHQC